MLRGVKPLCNRLGFMHLPRTLHALRHTFAVDYAGRKCIPSPKALGTLQLRDDAAIREPDDGGLAAVHQRVSLLAG